MENRILDKYYKEYLLNVSKEIYEIYNEEQKKKENK